MRKFIGILILLVVALNPALSYASGCCCLKSKAVMVFQPDKPPCHAQNDNTPLPLAGCFCDSGLSGQIVMPVMI